MPVDVQTHWYDYTGFIGFIAIILILSAVWIYGIIQSGKRLGKKQAELAKWHPQFRDGVYEYQQHENGTRRAIRIGSGVGVVDEEWIEAGADIVLGEDA